MTNQDDPKWGKFLFRAGDSYGLQVSLTDRQRMQLTEQTFFRKEISPDGQTISFHKLPDDEVEAFLTQFYGEHRELMRRLAQR